MFSPDDSSQYALKQLWACSLQPSADHKVLAYGVAVVDGDQHGSLLFVTAFCPGVLASDMRHATQLHALYDACLRTKPLTACVLTYHDLDSVLYYSNGENFLIVTLCNFASPHNRCIGGSSPECPVMLAMWSISLDGSEVRMVGQPHCLSMHAAKNATLIVSCDTGILMLRLLGSKLAISLSIPFLPGFCQAATGFF